MTQIPDKIKNRLPEPRLAYNKEKKCLSLGGTWLTQTYPSQENELSAFQKKNPPSQEESLQLHLEKDFQLDSTGALHLASLLKKFNLETDSLTSLPFLLKKSLEYSESPPTKEPPQPSWRHFLMLLGAYTLYGWHTFLGLLAFLGEVVCNVFHNQKKQKKSALIRWVSVVHHIENTGLEAIPIIALISLLIGAVLAYQGVNQLNRFGASIYTVDFLAISLLREISVLLTSIVVAGRSGSAFTAQIGTMGLNQEIDALKVLGLDPLKILVIPRLIGLLVSLPLLVLLSNLMGALGGAFITFFSLDMPFTTFFDLFQKAVSPHTFWVGMSKTPLFALIIGIIGCYRGLEVKGSAEVVGSKTTQAVVESIFLVIVSDGLISILYSYLDI